MPGVEVRADAGRDQFVHPLLRKLDHELAPDQHREDLPVDAEDVARAEHLPAAHSSILGEGRDDQREAVRDKGGVLGRFL